MSVMGSQLRRLLAEQRIVVAPGAYDTLSALLAKSAGFPALYLGGAWVACALLGA
ncbi:MAG: carboxyvinyl-carboxyphosphonate phosphorylmutase, partial [Chloroflexi bacterium]|nr:carboxyvinyl-carboxyphosphonate phosphorylmutase [Chloroflexota bacterium]